jgi:hypothetical protein
MNMKTLEQYLPYMLIAFLMYVTFVSSSDKGNVKQNQNVKQNRCLRRNVTKN